MERKENIVFVLEQEYQSHAIALIDWTTYLWNIALIIKIPQNENKTIVTV